MSRPTAVHRLAVLVALAVVVAIALLADRPSVDRHPERIPDAVDLAQVGAASYGAPTQAVRNRSMGVAAELSSASTTWFCGGAPAADTTLVLTNRADQTRSVLVTSVTSASKAKTRRLQIPAFTTRDLPGDDSAGTVGAVIESRHGGVVATQRITGQGSVTTAACATTSSDSWFFAGGDTQRGSSETLALFNPFDELATADVTFLTSEGFRHPQATQGLAVPARSVVLVEVEKVQNRRSDLGAVVTTRAGRIVTWRHQQFDGTGPRQGRNPAPKGVSLALGSSTPLTRFTLPTAVNGEGVTPKIILANPGATASTVRLSFAVDDPVANGQPAQTTVELMSGAVHVLDADDLRGVAGGVGFNVVGRVVSGGAIVAELWFNGAAPALGHGTFAAPAFGLASREWILPSGLGLPAIDQLGVTSSAAKAQLQLFVSTGGQRRAVRLGDQPEVVDASGRVTIDLATLLKTTPGATVTVTASSAVTVTRLQAGRENVGLVSTPGVPVAPHLSSP